MVCSVCKKTLHSLQLNSLVVFELLNSCTQDVLLLILI